MRKQILFRVQWAETYLKNPDLSCIDSIICDLSRWIGYFQHERLVHLIVTAVVAIITMMSALLAITLANIPAYMLLITLSILLIFYIGHYYTLENKTQYLYTLMDKIIKLKRPVVDQ